MAPWVYLVLFIIGLITGLLTRKSSKRVSAFGMIGDGIIGGIGGVIGGYFVALMVKSSSLDGLLLTIFSAISCSVLAVWITKFITKP